MTPLLVINFLYHSENQMVFCVNIVCRARKNYNYQSMTKTMNGLTAFWGLSPDALLTSLHTDPGGLGRTEAQKRLRDYGYNTLKPKKRTNSLALLIAQFKSPIMIILLFATGLSLVLHDVTDALIILAIILVSGFLGFWQERGAVNAVEQLLSVVEVSATVLRDGDSREVPVEQIVPGDIAILNAGDIIPGDCLILESRDLFVDEATLTGETYPVEKEKYVPSLKKPRSASEKMRYSWVPML
jgi:P-type Mg2+ transporter